jgi:type I restriction enzyme S subunit
VTTIWVELSELMVSKAGSVDPKKFADEKFELFSIPAFDRGYSELALGSEIGSSKQVVRPDDVMLSKIVPHIRRAWIVPASGDHRQIASGEWILFRSPRIYGPYLRHLLTSDFFNRQFMQTVAGVGGSLLRARPAHVAKIRVPLPLLDEQRRIAAILDKAEELRTKRRQALTGLDAFTQSIFHSMFGDPISNPMGWPMVRVGDALESAKYGSSEKAALVGTTPVLRMNNLTYGGQLDLSQMKYLSGDVDEKYLVRLGDVLFNRTNSAELVGKTAVYTGPEPMAYAGYLVRLRTNASCRPHFLGTFMNLPSTKKTLRNMCKSIVGMANINAQEVQTIKMPLPHVEKQNDFEARLMAINHLKDHNHAQLRELDTLFASLQHRAFKGEL